MIEVYFKSVKDKKFKKIETVRAGCWINIEKTSEEDLQKVSELTGLNMRDLQDSLDNYEVPRLERQEEGILMYVRTPAPTEGELHTELLTIITTDKYLITISPGKNSVINYILDQKTSTATTQKSKVVLRMLLRLAYEYTVQIKRLRTSVSRSTSDFSQIDTKDFIRLAQIEEVLNQYITALVPMNNVFEAIRSGKFISLYEEDADLVQDLLVGIKQSADICSVNLRSIRSIRDSYQVIFTNNLNKIIKLFTSLTVILTIPTIVASLFGMNVDVPFDEYTYAFSAITLSTVLASLFAIFFLYYKKWL
ncbi:MAG TPA: magnesium transporter CorA family protein [Candidatus Levybacteria bacterium]|nr:magnesium transporter CorA family protein [Candidatus Levybacteria bacterium]